MKASVVKLLLIRIFIALSIANSIYYYRKANLMNTFGLSANPAVFINDYLFEQVELIEKINEKENRLELNQFFNSYLPLSINRQLFLVLTRFHIIDQFTNDWVLEKICKSRGQIDHVKARILRLGLKLEEQNYKHEYKCK